MNQTEKKEIPMFAFRKRHGYVSSALLLSFFLVQTVCALSMQFMVTMPPVITNGTVSAFDIFGNGSGAQIFIILLDNRGDHDFHRGLALRYRVDYLPQDGSPPKKLYEGLSYPFVMGPFEQVPPISSKEFLIKNNKSVKVALSRTLFEMADSDPLKKQFLDTQKIPDGIVRYTMILEQNFSVLFQQSSDHTVINTSRVDLIAPGSTPSGMMPVIYNMYPLFVWTSDLPPNIYGNDDVFTLRLYKAKSGESAALALSRIPVFSRGTKTPQYQLTKQDYRLIPGATYYWEVSGFVKGVTISEIKSSPFGFKVAKSVNTEFWDIINTLRLIYGEDILEKVYDYDSQVTLKIDGSTITIEELREMVQKVQSETFSILSTTVD